MLDKEKERRKEEWRNKGMKEIIEKL
jgi:hypothetical protein